MSLHSRLFLACLLLAAGIALHQALLWHLAPIRNAERPELRDRLAALPITFQLPDDYEPKKLSGLRKWEGIDHPGRAEAAKQASFADEVLLRTYQPTSLDPVAALYAVYSRSGEDRNHHPEICIRDVYGAREDIASRKVMYLNGDRDRSVQRFRFQTGTDTYTVVYYWHYALTPPIDLEPSVLQRIYRSNGPRMPSVTVQVTTNAALDQLETLEASLLVAVDHAFRKTVLLSGVKMGCDRIPITLHRR